MTDDTGTEKPAFTIVPTLDGFTELVVRVEELEANQHAVDDGDDTDASSISEDDLGQVHDRLDRHRNEIEEIKRRYNQLIRFIGAVGLPNAQPADGNTRQ